MSNRQRFRNLSSEGGNDDTVKKRWRMAHHNHFGINDLYRLLSVIDVNHETIER